jgi:putative ABC transport system permease protein
MKKISNVLADINDGNTFAIEFKHFYLRPLIDLYLKGSATQMIYGEQGNNDLLWSFMAIGLFVLLLAIINYINLTTARSTLRSKEVIIKKVMGSSRTLLRQQFIAESILVAFISFLIALTTIQLIIPKFNQLAQLNISLSEFSSPIYWTMLLVGILTTGMISGIYPAMMLTTFRSVANIQAKSMSGTRGVWFRRLLLTFQFSISIILIIGIITNLQQLHFVKNADPGFNKDQVILVRTPTHFEESLISRETFKERLVQYPNILGVANGGGKPGQSLGTFQLEINGTMKFFQHKGIDPDYLDVMDIKLTEGRNFSWERLSDKYEGGIRGVYLINETAARKYWNESPVGKTYYFTSPDGKKVPMEIIGVVKDVHFFSFHHQVEPLVFYWGRSPQMSIKVSPRDLHETIDVIESEWKKIYGTEPFFYSFLDDEFEALYTSDERTAKIIGYFTILAIIIACMGLFALSSFMAVRRTKEIGIRKALGASSMIIFVMLSREYLKWILLSIVIASPIAWFAMNEWLQSFAYRIELGPDVFILAAILALVIGLITVGWQALKSANANPVESLRYE